jgi:hypothetical protein
MFEEKTNHNKNSVILIIAVIVGVILACISLFIAYKFSLQSSSNIILPNGTTYVGPSPTPGVKQPQPTSSPQKFKVDTTVDWKPQKGKIYPFSFSYPSTLPLVVFTDDATDSVAIAWGNIPPQQNILLNIEFIDKRDPKLVKETKLDYVKNWFKFFTGLKGVANVTPFTNTNGMKGYKAIYINTVDATPNVDVFFEIPNQPTRMLHMANGILETNLFDRIVDSVKWNKTN